MSRKLVFISVVIVLTAGVLGGSLWKFGGGAESHYKYNPRISSSLCGPRSLLIAFGRLGIPVTFNSIKSRCKITSEGTSFGELKAVCHKYGLEASTRQITWEELKQHDGVAVLFVRGNHFVVADPRETRNSSSVESPLIRIYDAGKLTKWMRRIELERIWQGESLIIQRSQCSNRINGPCVEWATCWEDFGTASHNDKASCVFQFKNNGSEPLSIKVLKTSCGCAHAVVSPGIVQPGDIGEVKAAVRLRGRRGRLKESVLITTNAPKMEHVSLYVRGTVFANQLVFPAELYFKQLIRGEIVTKAFVVQDPGDDSLEIREVSTKMLRANPEIPEIGVSVQWERVSSKIPLPIKNKPIAAHIRDGDFIISVTAKVPEKCATGKFIGTVIVSASTTNKEYELPVKFIGTVVPNVTVLPRAVLLLAGNERESSAQICFSEKSSKPLTVLTMELQGIAPVEITNITKLSRSSINVTVSCISPDLDTIKEESTLIARFDNNDILKVPILVIQKNWEDVEL